MGTETVTLPIGMIDDVSAAATERELFEAAAHWLPRTMDVSRGSLARARDGQLHLISFSGGRVFRDGFSFDIGPTLAGQAYLQRKAMVCNDMREGDCAVHARLVEAGFRSIIVAPLVTGDRCLGTLHAIHEAPDAFDALHLRKLAAMARWIASRLDILEQMAEIQRLSLTDHLTGTANRRAFLERAADALWSFHEGEMALSVLMFDLDHFKAVNDTHGHDGGDAVLSGIAHALRRVIRRTDLLARLGGEEFAILLEHTGLDGAMVVAERMRQTCENLEIAFKSNVIRATMSIGAAEACPEDTCVEDLLSRADKALYAAKHGGRNAVSAAA